MKTYVINLERSVKRRHDMEQQLSRLGIPFEMVRAVDGRALDMHDDARVDPVLSDVVQQRTGGSAEGVAGCALSHAQVYRAVLESTDEYAVVLEDDAVLPSDFPQLVGSVTRAMQGNEVVLLHFASREGCRVRRQGALDVGSSRLLAQPTNGCNLTSSAAYVITRAACRSLATHAVPVRTYPDDWDLFRGEGLIESVRCVVPMAVRHSSQFRSTIDYWEPESTRGRLGAWVERADVPVVKQLLSLRRAHQSKARGWSPSVTFTDAAER